MNLTALLLVIAALCTGYAAGVEFGWFDWHGNAHGWIASGAFFFILAHITPPRRWP